MSYYASPFDQFLNNLLQMRQNFIAERNMSQPSIPIFASSKEVC